ncbi:cell division protein FtsQ/DivIB [Cumulibacter soli]|uniref:cell division protein FtsQ/DivIB n=1 Tax=Cumulibacter soli TaxID=2546344 RepID=UPI00106783B1|nr:FtsQ-type POTRA domain-containing protein [Cumulibacter soli]
MSERRARTSSRVRPADRPRRTRSTSAKSSKGQRGPTRAKGNRGSVLNPGFPRWAIIALVAAVVLVSGGWIVFSSSLFGVREITVDGNTVLSDEEVQSAVALSENDALATVDSDEVAAQIRQLPPVADVTVSRSWPSTLQVTITERQPVATVTVGDEPWLIDLEGVAYAAATKAPEAAKGLLPLEIEDPGPESLATREAVAVIDGLDGQTRELVAKVTAPSAAQVTLVLKDGREVIWGDSSRMNDKLTMLPAVLSHEGSVLDISSPTAIVIK